MVKVDALPVETIMNRTATIAESAIANRMTSPEEPACYPVTFSLSPQLPFSLTVLHVKKYRQCVSAKVDFQKRPKLFCRSVRRCWSISDVRAILIDFGVRKRRRFYGTIQLSTA